MFSEKYLQPNASRSQSGFAFIAIVLFVIIIFSVMLVSGANDFAYSPEATKASPAGTAQSSPAPSGNATQPTNTPSWSITYNIASCANGIVSGKINPAGTSNGYVTLEIQEASGNYRTTSSDQFSAPNNTLTLILKSQDGYGTTPWRLNLYEGGTGTKDNFSGGTFRATIAGNPTGC